jgi:hypothetical protein
VAAAHGERLHGMRLVPLSALGALLAFPATALATSSEQSTEGTDHTTIAMMGLIVFLMVALIVIGVVEQRSDDH